jgi:hypothetical protein
MPEAELAFPEATFDLVFNPRFFTSILGSSMKNSG